MDDAYFSPGVSWSDRLGTISATLSDFEAANRAVVLRCLREDQLRIVINMPAEALLAMLGGDHYRNSYELPFVAGQTRGPSPKRISVDRLLGFVPDGRNHYFGAISLGGTGVRFYGEYCVVLRPEATEDVRVLDRNSYELLEDPLAKEPNPTALVQTLSATWEEVPSVLVLKVLLGAVAHHPNRLLPPGVVAETVLRDEDFLEVHFRQRIVAPAIEEVRQAPEEVSRETHLRQLAANGQMLRPEELIWASRRHQVDLATTRTATRNRIVTTGGRGARWR